ncbi:MAG: hypothetical protein ABSF24_02015 [Candidatus Bathyarchaeia archaeon]
MAGNERDRGFRWHTCLSGPRTQATLHLLEHLHYLQVTGFKEIKCYPDWKIKPPRKPKAEGLIFVSGKD